MKFKLVGTTKLDFFHWAHGVIHFCSKLLATQSWKPRHIMSQHSEHFSRRTSIQKTYTGSLSTR
jgi:hypothetical protein